MGGHFVKKQCLINRLKHIPRILILWCLLVIALAPFSSAAAPLDAPERAQTAPATDFPATDFLTGSWGGARDSLKKAGVSVGTKVSIDF